MTDRKFSLHLSDLPSSARTPGLHLQRPSHQWQTLMRSGKIGVAIALLVAVPAWAGGREVRLSQVNGDIGVVLSYRQEIETEGTTPRDRFYDLQMQIVRAGEVFMDQSLPASAESYGRSQPLAPGEHDRPVLDALTVRDLDGDEDPEVLVTLRTNPVGCCVYSQIYRYNSARDAYSYLEQNWGASGYLLRDADEDGNPELFAADLRFVNQFGIPAAGAGRQLESSNFTDAVLPLQVWKYERGRLVDITRESTIPLTSHAYNLWLYYWQRRQAGEPVTTDPSMKPVWAAYLADKYLLGEREEGWQVVRQAYQAGDRDAFFARLERFLQEMGYGS